MSIPSSFTALLVALLVAATQAALPCRQSVGMPIGATWKYFQVNRTTMMFQLPVLGPCPNCPPRVYYELHHKEVTRTLERNSGNLIRTDSSRFAIGRYNRLDGDGNLTVTRDTLAGLPEEWNSCRYDSLLDTSVVYGRDTLFLRFLPESREVSLVFSSAEGMLFYVKHYTDSVNFSHERIEDERAVGELAFVRGLFPLATGVLKSREPGRTRIGMGRIGRHRFLGRVFDLTGRAVHRP